MSDKKLDNVVYEGFWGFWAVLGRKWGLQVGLASQTLQLSTPLDASNGADFFENIFFGPFGTSDLTFLYRVLIEKKGVYIRVRGLIYIRSSSRTILIKKVRSEVTLRKTYLRLTSNK